MDFDFSSALDTSEAHSDDANAANVGEKVVAAPAAARASSKVFPSGVLGAVAERTDDNKWILAHSMRQVKKNKALETKLAETNGTEEHTEAAADTRTGKILQHAYIGLNSACAVARAVPGSDPHTIRESWKSVADIFFELQIEVLMFIDLIFSRCQPWYAIVRRKMDETQHYFRMVGEQGGNTGDSASYSWRILVILTTLRWRLTPASPEYRLPVHTPRIPMDGAKDEDIWYAIHLHPFANRITALLWSIVSRAVHPVYLREQDKAGANLRFLGHESNTWQNRLADQENKVAAVDTFCLSHGNNHVQDDLITDGGLTSLNFMYLAAKLFQMGAIWFQLLRALPKYARRHLHVVRGRPNADHVRMNKRIVNLVRMGLTETGRHLEEVCELLEEIAAFLNSSWFEGQWLVHVCSGEDCCPGGYETSLARLVKILQKLVSGVVQ